MSGMASTLPDSRGGDGPGESDAELVRAAREDPSAFVRLYERYEAGVYRYVRLRTGGPEDAADLTQQAFLRAMDALPGYDERGAPFAAWLYRIARNLAIDHGRRRRVALSWDGLPAALQPSSGEDAEAAILDRETRERLRRALMSLSPADRELVGLRFVARLRIGEVAAALGQSESTVHRRLRGVLGRLKEELDER